MSAVPPEVSVVVPTCDRRARIPELLAALESQAGAPPFELVIVDDGSTDGTHDSIATLPAPSFPLEVLRQERAGPAAARNAGIGSARGRLIALLGDDTLPDPGWLAAHRQAHRDRDDGDALAVIGHTRWHTRVPTTPFLEFINTRGPQFGFALIDDPENVPFNFFYSSNVSVPRTMLSSEPFDAGFPYAAWEDSELGYRLERRGLRIVYEPAATVAHDHPTDLLRFMDRQEQTGEAAIVFYRRHPELGRWLGIGAAGPPPSLPAPVVHAVGRLVAALPTAPPVAWRMALRLAYVRGLARGWARRDALTTAAPDTRAETVRTSRRDAVP